jgi:hypothetical protein
MKFKKIEIYMKKTRKERMSHLRLEESCIEIGGDSREFRSHLAFRLKTTIPRGMNVLLCHACNNKNCANPNHHYWGTPKDNHIDQVELGSYGSFWERAVKKHGLKEAKKIWKNNASKGGKVGGGKNKISKNIIEARKLVIIKSNPEKYGWVSRASKELNISHTQVKRFVNLYMKDLKYYKRK